MIAGAICLSHSPLLDRVRAKPTVERAFHAAVADASALLAAAAPDAVIVFHPDHLNGFAHGRIPEFCIGQSEESLGDFGTEPGALEVPAGLAEALADRLAAAGHPVELRSGMIVDHGAAQPLELLGNTAPIIPFFINCALAPRPDFRRVEALGRAVGKWAQSSGKRIVFIGSGGLSHDPPMQALPAGSEQDTGPSQPRILDHAARVARQARVYAAAETFAAGKTSKSRPLAPDWDVAFMDALASGRTDVAADWTDPSLTETAGSGGHEVRCWIAAMAALTAAGPYSIHHRFYAPVAEWLTGMGVMAAPPTQNDRA